MKISELTTAPDAIDGTELVPLVQDGTTYSVACEEIGGPAGIVDDSGSLDAGRGATTGKDSTGVYTVTLTRARTLGTWAPIAVIAGSASGRIACEVTSTTTFKVRTFNTSDVATDYSFNFTVVVFG